MFVPLVLVAAGFLGYSSYSTTFDFENWGIRSIIDSTFMVARAKVDGVEQSIIDSDNALLALVDLADLPALREKWGDFTDVSHAVDTLIVMDSDRNVTFYVSDHEGEKLGTILYDFRERIRPELELKGGRTTTLRHIHDRFGGRSYLVSYRSKQYQGQWYTICLNYNMKYIREVLLPDRLKDLTPKRLYNVVDTDGNIIVGRRFEEHGDFMVARTFPTTLYDWRLQVAPTQSALFEATSRKRYLYDAVTVGIAFVVIFLGMGFFIYSAEKERRLGELKGEFVANVSHELKTPLSIIRLFSEMLSMGRIKDPEKERLYHDTIIQECERLTSLIDNVLDFARLEGGRMKFELQEEDPGDVIRAAVEIYRYRLEREKIELSLDIPDGLGSTMMDRHAVTLLLVNLLDNAAKYAEGTDRVEVRVRREVAGLEISVRDWGIGIPASERRAVFERFYRGRQAQHSHKRGSGIGLTLVKGIVENMGGRIKLKIPPEDGGKGTQFLINLP